MSFTESNTVEQMILASAARLGSGAVQPVVALCRCYQKSGWPKGVQLKPLIRVFWRVSAHLNTYP